MSLSLGLLGGAESYIIAFLGFSALIVLHELGHFLLAKRTGMKATKFYLFFPPKAVGIKRGETEYGIGWLPLGGFVKIIGMTPEEEIDEADRPRAFYNRPVRDRIAVIFAGPAVNLIIAFLIFFGLAFGIQEGTDEVGELSSQSAATGVLEPGDRIVSIDGEDVSGASGAELRERVALAVADHRCAGEPTDGCRAKTPIALVVERGESTAQVSVRPRYEADVERMLIGFQYAVRDVNPGPARAATLSLEQMWTITSEGVFGIVPRVFESERRDEISSVVGIYEVTRQSVEFGAREALSVLGAISLVLAVLNLMPFLPLDGGHIAWALWEKAKGRRIPIETMAKVSSVGIIFLVFVVIIGFSNDIGRLTGEGFDLR